MQTTPLLEVSPFYEKVVVMFRKLEFISCQRKNFGLTSLLILNTSKEYYIISAVDRSGQLSIVVDRRPRNRRRRKSDSMSLR